mgnify:CR=1 FL=1
MLPQLAVVKETKSNIDASWNVLGNKFCVATASSNVFIGIYSEGNNFWIGDALCNLVFKMFDRLERKKASPLIKCSLREI